MTGPRAEAALRAGRIGPTLVLGIGALALIAVTSSGLSLPLRIGIVAWVASAVVANLRGRMARPRTLVFHPDRTLFIAGWRGRPRADFVSTLLVVLRCEGAATRRWALFRDQLDPESWQRLRAWLRHP